MNNVLSFVTLIGFVGSLPLEWEPRAEFSSVDEGNLIEGDIIVLKSTFARNLVRNESELWPNKVFAYKFSENFDELQKFNVETALIDLGYQTCVTFKERTDEPTYAIFKSYAKICAAVVGYIDLEKIGGELPIYVSSPGCEMRGKIQHEVLHSLGFWHEHTRPDRDEHVIVNWDNIKSGLESNFESRTWNDTQTLDLPYDLDSVMHYSKYAFSKNGDETLTPISERKNMNMGQRFRVSKLDIAKINRLYNCDDRYYKGD